MKGIAYLVGMGPGDPKLVTIRASEVVRKSTGAVVPSDLSETMLAYLSAAAERHASSTAAADLPLLLDLLTRGEVVSRLYVGDPLIGNDGAVLAHGLEARGVRFEIVPGLASTALAAMAGVPLAGQRGDQSFTVEGDSEGPSSVSVVPGVFAPSWLARAIPDRSDRPALLIHEPATPRQHCRQGSVAELATAVRGMDPRDLLVAGSVAGEGRLGWFASRPLFGVRVVVTRPRVQARQFVEALEAEGAEVLALPTIRIADPEDVVPLRQSADEVASYDWIVFTSVNGVERFWQALENCGGDSRSLAGVAVCAIGSATADALGRYGVRPDVVPGRFVAEAAVEALSAADLRGKRVLMPRAEIARSVLPDSLKELGAEVTEITAYRTLPDQEGIAALKELFASGGVNVVTFTSSSTARNFGELVTRNLGGAKVASIGPITSATARAMGWKVDIEAPIHTADGLREALLADFGSRGRQV